MPYYDTEETDEAVRLYRSHARRRGLIACQPDRDLTRREGDVIHIRNANGDLARYRILPDGRIVKTG